MLGTRTRDGTHTHPKQEMRNLRQIEPWQLGWEEKRLAGRIRERWSDQTAEEDVKQTA